MKVKLDFKLHCNQKVIHSSPARYKVIKAGKRFGKTKLAIFWLLQMAGRFPGCTFWYIAPTYKQAKNIAWRELLNLIPKELILRKNETDLIVELVYGTIIQLHGAENPENIRGIRIKAIVVDEAAYMKEEVWTRVVYGQLLDPLAESCALFISSPNYMGRNWYSRFYDEAKAKQEKGNKEWAAFYYTIYDNPTIPKEEIDKLKDGMPDGTWSVEYMGLESDFAGQLYHEFNRGSNLSEYVGESSFPHYRAIDWGLDHPTVCLFARLDPFNKILYVYDEYVRSDKLIHEVVTDIQNRSTGTNFDWTVIDPSANRRSPDTKRSIKDEFSRYGLYCLNADNKDRGYDITRMFLKKNMLVIHPKCKTLIYELENLQTDSIYKTRASHTIEGDDATDALRYLCIRVHDYVNGMNVLVDNTKPAFEKLPVNTYSLHDDRLFPERVKENQEQNFEWVLEGIE